MPVAPRGSSTTDARPSATTPPADAAADSAKRSAAASTATFWLGFVQRRFFFVGAATEEKVRGYRAKRGDVAAKTTWY